MLTALWPNQYESVSICQSGNASRTLTYGKESFLVGQGVPSVWDSLTSDKRYDKPIGKKDKNVYNLQLYDKNVVSRKFIASAIRTELFEF